MRAVGTTAIQPASFPGMGNNSFQRNGVTHTTIATKPAVINKFEESFLSSPGVLDAPFDRLPHLAIEIEHPNTAFTTKATTFELPHRIGSGVFAIKNARSPDWNFPEQLYEKMTEVGPYNAIAYFDPISALLGCFLSHYQNIPNQWSKFTGSVVGGCIASGTQPVISAAVTQDPLGANKENHFFMESDEKGKASINGLGNIIHLESDVDAEQIILNLHLNQQRLRFYHADIQELLVLMYQYGALKVLNDGFDFRNRCFLKPTVDVEFNQAAVKKKISASINKCLKQNLLSPTSLSRVLPVSHSK